MYSPTPPPPVPPPKPGSHDSTRLGTPATSQSPRLSPLTDTSANVGEGTARDLVSEAAGLIPAPPGQQQQRPPVIPDPGQTWLPKFLEDKSKQDLATILSTPSLLDSLTHSPNTAHASLAQSHQILQASLADNIALAQHLTELEARLVHQRAATQAQLLSTHALERQWRAKQSEMDVALAPFAPASLYGRLTAGLQEQEGVCEALEQSFLEGDGSGTPASERDALDWVRRYREAMKVYYLRSERKERWNERRVGGWR